AFYDQLSERQAEAGELAGAVETAQRWVAHAPLSEAAARRLMHSLLAVGDREAALRAYQAIAATLASELGAEPEPDTQALLQRLRAPASPSAPAARLSQSQPARLPALEAPLVGRAAPMAQLMAGFRAASQGQTQALLIEGEAGIGKSRLADEFLRWAAAQGALVLAGHAFEAGGRPPHSAPVEAPPPPLGEAAGSPGARSAPPGGASA